MGKSITFDPGYRRCGNDPCSSLSSGGSHMRGNRKFGAYMGGLWGSSGAWTDSSMRISAACIGVGRPGS